MCVCTTVGGLCLLEVVVCVQLLVHRCCVFIGSGSVVVCTQLMMCVQLLVWWCVFIGSGSVVC